MGIVLSQPHKIEDISIQEDDSTNMKVSDDKLTLPTEEGTVRWLQQNAFINVDPAQTHHPIPAEVLRESIARWRQEDDEFVPPSSDLSDDDESRHNSKQETTEVDWESTVGWRSVVWSWNPPKADLNSLQSELLELKKQLGSITQKLEAQQELTTNLTTQLAALQHPSQNSTSAHYSAVPVPMPPPLPEDLGEAMARTPEEEEEEVIMGKLVAQVNLTELSDADKATAVKRYLGKFSKNPKALQKLLLLHPYLVTALPLNPKKAFSRMELWEQQLFGKVAASLVAELRLQKRFAVSTLANEADILADIKLTQLVLAKRRLDSIAAEERAAAAGKMQDVLSELHNQLHRRQDRPVASVAGQPPSN